MVQQEGSTLSNFFHIDLQSNHIEPQERSTLSTLNDSRYLLIFGLQSDLKIDRLYRLPIKPYRTSKRIDLQSNPIQPQERLTLSNIFHIDLQSTLIEL
ncbi:hypothetical protein CDAR_394191 [Caerostris darwini]|uniref:Uncharacterized protein n=1 Tax=Caerostris darwini TaxID=1538125 RepID=A0AAV4RHF2_9ARAC|nr:hypothetical protein CDAR_394191 [Caerostris darwini]